MKISNFIVMTLLGGFALTLNACSKKERDAAKQVNPKPDAGVYARTTEEYESDLEKSVQAASYGLVQLRGKAGFVQLVREMANKRFDGENNVLFADLVEPARSLGIDLKEEMIGTLNAIGKGNLVPYIPGVLGGFEYFDTKAYLHIYIPFEKTDVKPTIVLNPFGNTNECKAISTASDLNPVLIDITEDKAFDLFNWVVAANERVDINGKPRRSTLNGLSKTTNYSFDGSLWIQKVKYSSDKEVWANGGPEVSYVTYSTQGSGSQRMVGSFCNVSSRNKLEQWHMGTSPCECAMAKTYSACQGQTLPDFFANNAALYILYFERDFAKRTDRTEYIAPGLQNSQVTFGSTEGPYGNIALCQDPANGNAYPVPAWNNIYGLDVEYGYNNIGGTTANTFQVNRFQ